MKKLLIVVSTFVMLIALTACSTSGSSGSNKVTAKAPSILYTQELPYVPAYSADMKADSTSTTNTKDFTQANYTIQNASNATVFDTYEKLLKQDGWTITSSTKPNNIAAKKGKHIVTMSIMKYSNNITKLIIMAK